MRRMLIVLAILAIPNLAWAEGYTNGNLLYQQLSSWRKFSARTGDQEDMITGMIGLGYVIGAIDAVDNCVPQQVTRGQAAEVVFRYLDAHPELRPFLAASLVKAAVAEKFPCQKGPLSAR